MSKIRIGILGPADIALRRMVPAILKCEEFEYMGVAVAFDGEKKPDHVPGTELSEDDMLSAQGTDRVAQFAEKFGGMTYNGYAAMLEDEQIDAVYIALPPSLHYKWAAYALQMGKHVFLEKPFTTCLRDSEGLVKTARERSLAVTENFAFCYHAQVAKIKEIMESGILGQIRLIRSNFAFPFRGAEDFRYKKSLGGGALLDCGCYTLKMASLLLGDGMKITGHTLKCTDGFDVDMYGAITAEGAGGEIAQLSFGMDQQYNCELEIWGNKGCLRSPRIYTPPADHAVELAVTTGMDKKTVTVEPDDQFAGSARAFADMITDRASREDNYEKVLRQSALMEECKERCRS